MFEHWIYGLAISAFGTLTGLLAYMAKKQQDAEKKAREVGSILAEIRHLSDKIDAINAGLLRRDDACQRHAERIYRLEERVGRTEHRLSEVEDELQN